MNEKISESIVIKLFDQVSDSSEKNTESIERLTTIVGQLNETLGDTNREAEREISGINKNIEEQNIEISKIKGIAYKIYSKVITMIVVVAVAFTLMVGSYFFVSKSIDKTVDYKLHIAIEEVLKGKQ